MTNLTDLLARVEAASGPDRAIDGDVCVAMNHGGENSGGAVNVKIDPDDDEWLLFECGGEDCCNRIPPLTASIDAALALAERVLPGRWRNLLRKALNDLRSATTSDPSGLALSVTAAILKALIAAETKEPT